METLSEILDNGDYLITVYNPWTSKTISEYIIREDEEILVCPISYSKYFH